MQMGLRHAALALLIATVGQVGAAASSVWTFSVCNGTQSAVGTAFGTQNGAGALGNEYRCAADGSVQRQLAVTAWGASAADGNVLGPAHLSNLGVDGFGVGSAGEGGPAAIGSSAMMDNDPTSLAPNLILLSFPAAVVLERLTLGAGVNDRDLTLLAYTGALAPLALLTGLSVDDLTAGGAAAGWSLIEAVGDAAPDVATSFSTADSDHLVNAGGVAAPLWLVSAHSARLAGAAALDSLVDHVGLLSVSTREPASDPPPAIPEPGTAALLVAGVAMLARRRRRAVLAGRLLARSRARPTAPDLPTLR